MTTSDFDERMQRHRELLASANFKRVSYFMCEEARRELAAQRRRGESLSSTLNRLLLARGCARNESAEETRDFERRVKHARNVILHSLQPSNRSGQYTVAVRVLRPDGSGVRVTADSVEPFDTQPP